VQRKRGADCDAPLLYACILPSLDSGEFFLRKGIGWALRERARAAPDEVRAFCAEYRERMAPLTRREALKHIGAAD
jgi:3-methyladenine DNA glycosylase AlkD